MLRFSLIGYGSGEYHETVRLRYEILRKPLGLEFTSEQLEAEVSDVHLACYSENILAACLIMTPVSNHTVKMRQFAVAEAFQKIGIGTALVKFAEEWANANGYKEIILHARETAIPFYLRLGYKKEGDRFTEVTIPHYFMRKQL